MAKSYSVDVWVQVAWKMTLLVSTLHHTVGLDQMPSFTTIIILRVKLHNGCVCKN